MRSSNLPADFRDLEPFFEWALESRVGRLSKRVNSPLEKITAFYTAMVPRLDAIVTYLNSRPLGDLKPGEKSLLAMALSLIEISRCVELWQAPDIPAFAANRLVFDL